MFLCMAFYVSEIDDAIHFRCISYMFPRGVLWLLPIPAVGPASAELISFTTQPPVSWSQLGSRGKRSACPCDGIHCIILEFNGMLVFLAVFFYRVTISGTVALWRRSGATFLTFVYFDIAKALEGFKIGRYLHYVVLLLWCSGGDLRPHSLLDGSGALYPGALAVI